MHEDRSVPFREDDIGLSGQAPVVKAEAEPLSMQCLAQFQFGLRVGATDTRHHSRSRFGIDDVGHSFPWRSLPDLVWRDRGHVRSMSSRFKVVDLFAGPGGLAEGFSRFRDPDGNAPFGIALSVEKEASAFSTLRLRSFVRQFSDAIPDAYYRYVAREIDWGDLIAAYPEQWAAACHETLQLELGAPGSSEILYPLLDDIRAEASGNTILIGGPPCQAYSLVGRARNRGIADYVPGEDHRHYLYREYIGIIERLRPVAFIMENVKGILSARLDGQPIFPRILEDLKSAGGTADSYELLPLLASSDHRGSRHVIECERFGIPQRRHRVILFGIRRDVADARKAFELAPQFLEPASVATTVTDVLASMAPLRSGLSKGGDSPERWKTVVVAAFRTAARAAAEQQHDLFQSVARALDEHATALELSSDISPRRSTEPAAVRNNLLAAWLVDPKLTALPNHEARGHMDSDLSRYAFAAVFSGLFDRAPKAADYPAGLAPDHANWSTGKFADRFRVQRWTSPSTTVTSHISKDGHYFIHPDPLQCRSLTVREAARLQTFPDNYLFEGNRTQQYVQVGNAVPPLLAFQIAGVVYNTVADPVGDFDHVSGLENYENQQPTKRT